VFTLPTIQAVMRQQGRIAAKGNGPALRHFIDRVHAIEQEEVQAATKAAESIPFSSVTDEERAQALIAFLERTGLKVSPRNVAQDTTENSDLDNLQDRLKSTVRQSKED
jgi:hypothetical protein